MNDLGVDGFPHIFDEEREVWSEFGIRSQPAFAFINNDGAVDLHSGRLGADSLTERIDALLAQ